jgi:hypothetical protein
LKTYGGVVKVGLPKVKEELCWDYNGNGICDFAEKR